MTTINLHVTYSQVAIFDSALSNPFNDWWPQHVEQGFAWRDGSVSFRTHDESAQYSISLHLCDEQLKPHPESIEAICVPFEVPNHQVIEVGSISDGIQLELNEGCYQLMFEEFSCKSIQLSLCRCSSPTFEILKSSRVTAAYQLLTTAEAAT